MSTSAAIAYSPLQQAWLLVSPDDMATPTVHTTPWSAGTTPVASRHTCLPIPMKVWSWKTVSTMRCVRDPVVKPAGGSAGEYSDWPVACEMRCRSEGNRGRGKVRRQRGRRLLIVRRLLLLGRLLCRLLCCCFLRCHEHSTPLQCQNVSQCVWYSRVRAASKILFSRFFSKSEQGLRPLAMERSCLFRTSGGRTNATTPSTIPRCPSRRSIGRRIAFADLSPL
jgi:hypothetical protein